ncbi:MAG: hypothetical protein CME71_00235 [Halobacteriovorax sp.]|nr:hypothetical protein [Halobacteriovorax sp.]|tara:strand:+ start:465 stop:851 length:387 start_codon:yes stop_codon:yes gene_type:complete
MSIAGTKVCKSPACKSGGTPQTILNFYKKSSHGNKTYHDRFCKNCRNSSKKNTIQKNPSITSGGNYNLELAIPQSNEAILNQFNQENPAQELTTRDFQSAINAIIFLSKWSKIKQQHPGGRSRTKLLH